MKTKKIFGCICIVLICIAATKKTFAQQQANVRASNQMLQQVNSTAGSYSIRVFMASNKTYGYDIMSNAKVIYHQSAFSRVPSDGDVMLTKKEQANTAALLAIDKIKKGMNPELSNEELRKITTR